MRGRYLLNANNHNFILYICMSWNDSCKVMFPAETVIPVNNFACTLEIHEQFSVQKQSKSPLSAWNLCSPWLVRQVAQAPSYRFCSNHFRIHLNKFILQLMSGWILLKFYFFLDGLLCFLPQSSQIIVSPAHQPPPN